MCKEAVASYFPHHNGICLEKTDENHENVGSWYQSSGQVFPLRAQVRGFGTARSNHKNRLNKVFTYHSINYTGLYLQPTIVI
jgi:hypothetical protein